MHTILETSQTLTNDKKNFTRRLVESLNIDQDSITAKIRDDKFDFFTKKLIRIIELSGIDRSEILNFEIALDPQSKSIMLTGDLKQAAKVLFQENAISEKTYQKTIDTISEIEFNKLEQFAHPDKLAEMCLKSLHKIINDISDANRDKTTKSIETLLDGLKNAYLQK